MSKNLTIILMLANTVYVNAQQDTTFLQEVVITANRTSRSLDEVDRSVSVIGQEEIRKLPYQNVAELLSTQPGLYVVGQGQNPGTNQSLFLRGANANQMNVLIDGVRITDPSTPGGSLDLSELSLIHVERIEILRGSHGTMYGTSGIGGVINIITKKDQPGWTLDAQVQGGVFKEDGSSLKTGVMGRYQLDNGLYASAGFENVLVNGLDATEDTTAQFHIPDRDDFEKMDYYGQFGYAGADLDINLFYKRVHQRSDLDAGAFVDDENYFLQFDRNFLNLKTGYNFGKWTLEYQGGFSDLKRTTENDSSVVDMNGKYDGMLSSSENTGQTYTNEFQGLFGKESFSVLIGAGQYKEAMNLKAYSYSGFGEFSSDLDSLELSSNSYYGFAQAILGGKLVNKALAGMNLTLGARGTHHSRFGGQATFEITPGYHLKNGKIFLSMSTGYKNPSLIQLFDPAVSPGYVTNRGNDSLMPEQSLSFELGWDQTWNSLKLNAALFQTEVKNVIEYIYLWDDSSKNKNELDFTDYRGDTYVNLSHLTSRGIELGLAWAFFAQLKLNANYSYTHGEVDFNHSDLDEDLVKGNYVQLFSNGKFLEKQISESQLVRRPSNLINARLHYEPMPSIGVAMNYRFVDSRPDSFYDAFLGPYGALNTTIIGSYHLFDLYGFYEMKDFMDLGIRIENIFNTDFREIQGFNTRGRGIYLKLTYTLTGK